jgi:hypothetical protein
VSAVSFDAVSVRRELVNSLGRTICESPLCPESRQVIASRRTAASGHERTNAPQQNSDDIQSFRSTAVWADGEAERVIVWVLVLHPNAARDFLPSLIHEIRVASIHYPGGSPAYLAIEHGRLILEACQA